MPLLACDLLPQTVGRPRRRSPLGARTECRRSDMRRRTFLAGAATSIPLSRAIAQTGKTSLLRYVPQADLTVIDPVMTTAYITRYHATMVYDQLYGVDD